jgi:DNA-binding HxlR family transcriptional regulator
MKIPAFESVELGEPWRLSKESQGVAVPILLQDPSRKRDYKLLDEVKDKVELKDTNVIDNLQINNKSGDSVFIRKGTMLTGGTQHRAVQVSVVAAPNSVTDAPIRCVYASKGIRGGATFTAVTSSYVPRVVEKSLRHGQGETWGAVSAYAMNISADYSGSVSAWTRSDNLTDVVEKSTKVIDDAMKDVPADHVRQIGLVVVGSHGVEGLEMFDHPDSWKALSKGVIRNYADILTNVIPDIFEINIEKVKEYVFAFLSKIQNVEGVEAFCSSDSKTFEFQTNDVEGEFTMLDEGLIHILANAIERGGISTTKYPDAPIIRNIITNGNDYRTYGTNDWPRPENDNTYRPNDSFTISYTSGDEDFKKKSDTVNLMTKKRGYETLSDLIDGAKTFTEIQGHTGMSSKTVDQGLKEAESLGLVEKTVRNDGATAYKLTSSGTKANPKKFKASFQ